MINWRSLQDENAPGVYNQPVIRNVAKEDTLHTSTNREEPRQILLAVVPRKRSDALGHLQLSRDTAPAVAFEKLRDDDRVGRIVLDPRA